MESDRALEQGLLAAICSNTDLYWQLANRIPEGAFTASAAEWKAIRSAIEDRKEPPQVPWSRSSEPEKDAQALAERYYRGLLAKTLASLTTSLRSQGTSASQIVQDAEDGVARIRQAIHESESGQVKWADNLLTVVLRDARERQRQREETGSNITGLPTGLSSLDEVLNGLMGSRLYILAGMPGSGKTTLCPADRV